MPDHKLEDKFREELDGYVSPIDADALWNDMQKGKKKKFPFWWIVGGFSFLVLAGLIYFIQPDTMVSDATNNSTHKPKVDKQSQSVNDFGSEKNPGSQSKLLSKEEDNKNQNIEDLKQSSINNTKTQQKSAKTINKTNYSKTSTYSAKSKSPIGSFEVTTSNAISEKAHNLFTPINESTNSENVINSSNEQIEKAASKKAIPLDKSEQKTYRSKAEKEIAKVESKTLNKLNLVALTPFLYNTIEPNYKPEWVKKVSDKNNKNPKLELGIYYSYEYAFRKLTGDGEDQLQTLVDYIDLRNDSETFVESYRTGINIRKTFKGGIRGLVGIEYAKLTERFDASIDRGLIAVRDSSISAQEVFVQRTNIKKIFNRFQSVNIPLMIGKSFSVNKWLFYVDAGITFNIASSANGQIFKDDQAEEVLEFRTEGDDGSLFNNVSINYLASAGVNYKLNKNVSLELGPYWQTSSTSMIIREPFSINTTRNHAGLKLSLVKSFR